MFRRIVLAVAMATAATVAAPQVATAHTDACVFRGTLFTFGTLPAVTIGTGPTFDWLMIPSVGTTCVTTAGFLAGGQITGSVLGTTTGSGTLSGGHDFSFTGVAGALVVAGEAVGTMVMTPDPLANGDIFFAEGTLALLH